MVQQARHHPGGHGALVPDCMALPVAFETYGTLASRASASDRESRDDSELELELLDSSS